VLEEGRRLSGLNMLSYLFDGLRRYRKEQGRLLLTMIRRYIPQGRLIRVAGPAGMQYVPLVYDDGAVEYDVIVDEAPTSPNVKQRTWEAFTLLAQTLPQVLSPQIAAIALDYSPFPQAMVEKIKQQAAAPGAPPSAAPSPVEQAEIGELAASARFKDAQAQHLQSQGGVKLVTEAFKAQGARSRALGETARAQADAHKAAAEILKAGTGGPPI